MKKLWNKVWAYAFAGVIAVTGVGVGTIATATAAEAVPYKIPAGYWGGTTYYRDVHAYWHGDREVRYRYHTRMYWDGTKWYDAIYYNGYYYSGTNRA